MYSSPFREGTTGWIQRMLTIMTLRCALILNLSRRYQRVVSCIIYAWLEFALMMTLHRRIRGIGTSKVDFERFWITSPFYNNGERENTVEPAYFNDVYERGQCDLTISLGVEVLRGRGGGCYRNITAVKPVVKREERRAEIFARYLRRNFRQLGIFGPPKIRNFSRFGDIQASGSDLEIARRTFGLRVAPG